MFENFTFGAAPTNSYHQYNYDQPSPRDDSFPTPVSPTSGSYPFFEDGKRSSPISDIAYQFSQSTFFNENARDIPARQYLTPTPSLCDDSDISSPTTTTKSMPATPIVPLPRPGTLACRRMQRQINVQLQCSSAHIRDINALVEDMLSTSSQCCLRKPLSYSRLEIDSNTQNGIDATEREMEKARRKWMNTVVHANDIDEGYVEGDISDKDSEDMATSLRRASTPSGIRKNGLRCRTSMETVGGGRVKAAKLPRMKTRRQGTMGKVVV